jgi:hypothetical protein
VLDIIPTPISRFSNSSSNSHHTALHKTTQSHPLAYETATKNPFSPSLLSVLARSLNPSPTANLNLSAVAGLSIFQPSPPFPFICLAALIASLSAKNTVAPRNNGGSPIPLLLWTLRKWFQVRGLPSLSLRSMLALKDCGMSLKPGIL